VERLAGPPLARQLLDRVTGAHHAAHHDPAVGSSKAKLRPVGELTNLGASTPNRAENFAHPVCGASLNSITADPI
jgi:hypothetical protein